MKSDLRSTRFREERRKTWFQLEELLDRIEEHGLDALSADELSQLPRLYRSTLSGLATARSISLDRNLLEYLESLANRAYIVVYSPRKSTLAVVREFFSQTFPRSVRELGRELGVAWLLLLVGVWAGARLVELDPEFFYTFVPADLAGGRGPAATTESLRDVLFDAGGGGDGQLAYFASFLVSHNARIGLMCFALGLAAGFPVIYLLFTNGAVLGAFFELYASRGLSTEFLSWVLPHGITEFLAVALCGAAGLHIGMAVAFPGSLSRLDSLKLRGKPAGAVVLGTVAMFFAAALIEGFFRQMVQDLDIRFVMAGSTALFWFVYLGFVGRDA